MLKTLTAIAALAALLAVNITPAHAALGDNGGGANGGGSGTSEESSTLSIQAFELPAETR